MLSKIKDEKLIKMKKLLIDGKILKMMFLVVFMG